MQRIHQALYLVQGVCGDTHLSLLVVVVEDTGAAMGQDSAINPPIAGNNDIDDGLATRSNMIGYSVYMVSDPPR